MHLTLALLLLITLTYVHADFVTVQRLHARIEDRERLLLQLQEGGEQPQRGADGVEPSPASTLWFNQRIDHFSPLSNATFRQRVYVNGEHYKGRHGRPSDLVFLYIGGEAELTARSVLTGGIVELAKKHGALVVGVEHRYYGKSHPFEDLSTEHLSYLTSQQALNDLAHFIAQAPEFLTASGWPVTDKHRWLTVGGSYPGNLAAWFRLKFPHLTIGSWASSAPVRAKSDYFEYDQVVREQLGEPCARFIQRSNNFLESVLESGNTERITTVKRWFHPEMDRVTDSVAFLYVLADIVAYTVQYDNPGSGLRDRLCSSTFALLSGEDAARKFAAFTQYYFDKLRVTPQEMDMTSYTYDEIRDPSDNQRQWMWQCCVEFGYWQIAPATNPLRSRWIDEQWHLEKICHGLYGMSARHQVPVEATNAVYGGLSIAGAIDRIAFTNGGRDPWKELSVEPNHDSRILNVYTNRLHEPFGAQFQTDSWLIDGVGHCADLRQATAGDPLSLVSVRQQVFDDIASWIDHHQPATSPQQASK